MPLTCRKICSVFRFVNFFILKVTKYRNYAILFRMSSNMQRGLLCFFVSSIRRFFLELSPDDFFSYFNFITTGTIGSDRRKVTNVERSEGLTEDLLCASFSPALLGSLACFLGAISAFLARLLRLSKALSRKLGR